MSAFSTDTISGAKERILQAAGNLFYREGFHAVGIDRIISESGVAKMTLYRHFPSKDALIVAYLAYSHQAFWHWFESSVEHIDDPRKKIIGVFEAQERLAASPRCLGCTFQSSAAEFPDISHPAHQAANSHKEAVLSRFTAWAREAGLSNPEVLAQQLLLLMDGAWVAVRMFGAESAARYVADAAKKVIGDFTTTDLKTQE